jgi:hypothetical protein
MMTTLGDLVTDLYESYEAEYRDCLLAAVATQVSLFEILKKPPVVHHRPVKRPRKRT